MKEQYTVRIYDTKLANKLEKIFETNKDIYGTMNPFMVDCVNRGLDSIAKDLCGEKNIESVSELYGEIQLTIDKLNSLIKLCEKNAKETIANLTVNQKLLSCNYNMLLGLSENAPKKRQTVETGLYDDLPERLEDLLEEVLTAYLKK